jgi:hypothetical protein
MKREEFLITSTEGHSTVKYKWNSARKEVQRLMQEFVNKEGERELLSFLEYELTENKSEKQGFHFVSGVMGWKEKTSGKEISFFITKIA